MRMNILWDICVFCRHVSTPNLLLCDGHEPHTGDSIMAEFSGHQSDRLLIPGGCTSKLQPLDVSLKSMFHVRECAPISYQSILVVGLWQYMSKFNIFIVGCLLCGVVCGGTLLIIWYLILTWTFSLSSAEGNRWFLKHCVSLCVV